MGVFIFGLMAFLVIFIVYAGCIKAKHECILEQIAMMDNGAEKDRLLKEKSRIEVQQLIIAGIGVIIFIIGMVCKSM